MLKLRQRQTRIPEPAKDSRRYILVLVQTPVLKWWAEVPEEDAVATWQDKGLHYRPHGSWRFVSAAFLGVALPLIPSVVLVQFWGLGATLLLGLLLSVVGARWGWSLGLWQERRLTRQGRFYALRATFDQKLNTRSVEPMGYERLSAMATHQQVKELAGEDAGSQAAPISSQNGKKQAGGVSTAVRERVYFPWTAHSLYQLQGMKDWREFLKGGVGIGQKVTYVALAVMAVSVLLIVFLTFAASPPAAGVGGP